MKVKGIISNDFDLDKWYSGHDPEYSRGINWSDILRNANIDGTVTFKCHDSKSSQ